MKTSSITSYEAATAGAVSAINTLVRKHSSFISLEALITAPGYVPTLRTNRKGAGSVELNRDMAIIADAYDKAQFLLGDRRRAYRG